MIVKRIGVLSLGKVLGTIYGTLGLIFGLIFSLVSLLGIAFGAVMDQAGGSGALMGTMFGALFGLGAVVVLPILYGAMGFVLGLLVAAVYNFAARAIGGLELEVE